MPARRIVLGATLAMACVLMAAFASSPASRSTIAAQGSGATSTDGTVEVEVGGKVVEAAPDKTPVDLADLARTGSDRSLPLAGFGLALAAFGIVLLDVVAGPPPRRRQTAVGLPRR